jgi:hypothetical protein
MSAEFAQACDFKFVTLQWLAPVPGLGPDLCHDRGLAFPRPWEVLCWCDSGTGSLLCYGFGTGMWQWYESTPLAVTAVNRHQSSISSLESLSTSKYPQLSWGGKEYGAQGTPTQRPPLKLRHFSARREASTLFDTHIRRTSMEQQRADAVARLSEAEHICGGRAGQL